MRVQSSFWSGDTGRALRKLGHDSQVMAMYLITSPHASAIGLYSLPMAYICHDTGMTLEGASKVLRCLSEVQFAAYDFESETVWVPEMARHQLGDTIGEKDKRFRWIHKEAERMSKSPFFPHFIHRYGRGYSMPYEAPSKPLPSPFDGPSKPEPVQQQQTATANSNREQQHARARGASRLTLALSDERVVRILTAYRELHGKDERWKFDAKEEGTPRAVRVLDALEGNGRDQLTEDEVLAAIRGNKSNEWHAKRGKHEIEYVLRNDNVHGFITEARQGAPSASGRRIASHDEHRAEVERIAGKGAEYAIINRF